MTSTSAYSLRARAFATRRSSDLLLPPLERRRLLSVGLFFCALSFALAAAAAVGVASFGAAHVAAVGRRTFNFVRQRSIRPLQKIAKHSLAQTTTTTRIDDH